MVYRTREKIKETEKFTLGGVHIGWVIKPTYKYYVHSFSDSAMQAQSKQ